MPRGDRTGPEGRGPRTGRALGYCTGNDAPGYASNLPGMGKGRGPRSGEGLGRGKGYGPGRGRGGYR